MTIKGPSKCGGMNWCCGWVLGKGAKQRLRGGGAARRWWPTGTGGVCITTA